MNSWQQAAEKLPYGRALLATASLTKDQTGVGFVKPHELQQNQVDSASLKQQNTIIFLLADIQDQLSALRLDIILLKQQIAELKKEKAPEIKLAPEELDQLTKAFTEKAKLGDKVKGKQTTGEFRVWRS